MRVFAIVLGLVLGVASARADSDVDRLFVEGRDLMKKGEYQAACDRFHAANALDARAPSVMLNLGLCYEQLGKLATSLRWFRKAQTAASEAQPPVPEFEEAAKEKKRDLAGRVATVKIDAARLQPEGVVFVDGAQLRREELSAPLELDRGRHAVTASAPGLVTFTAEVTINDGEARTVTIAPLAAPAPATAAPVSRRGLGLAIGIPSALLVVGIPLAAYALQQAYKDDHEPANAPTLMKIMGGVWVAGVAGVIVGGYYLWRTPRARAERRTAVVPVVGGGHAGAALIGTF